MHASNRPAAFPTIATSDINQWRKRKDFRVARVDCGLDIIELNAILDNVLERYNLAAKDGYEKYFAIGLQYEDESDPFYDAVQQTAYCSPEGLTITSRDRASLFHKTNEIGRQFQAVLSAFPGTRLFRGRILMARPGMIMNRHTDGPESLTLHVPLRSKPQSYFFLENERHHFPADGSAYLVNTSLAHHMENHSTTDRIHLTFKLNYFSFSKAPDYVLEPVYKLYSELNHREAHEFSQYCLSVKHRDEDTCQFCGAQDLDIFIAFWPCRLDRSILSDFDRLEQAFCLCRNCYINENGFSSLSQSVGEDADMRLARWLSKRTSSKPLARSLEKRLFAI